MENPVYLKIIIFLEFRGFWLKKTKNWFEEYSKRPDPLKLIKLNPVKFLYFT